MTTPVKQYGVRESISMADPTKAEVQSSSDFGKFLVEVGIYESKEEAAKSQREKKFSVEFKR